MESYNGHKTEQRDNSKASRPYVHMLGSLTHYEVHTFPKSSTELTRYPMNRRTNIEGQKEQRP